MFEDLFKNKIENDVLSFLNLLIEKGRILELESMLSQMENIYLEKHNTSIARVVTVLPLLEKEKSELIDKLQKKYNKKVILQEELANDILGGVYVWIDNEVIDGTVRSKIEEMKKLILRLLFPGQKLDIVNYQKIYFLICTLKVSNGLISN